VLLDLSDVLVEQAQLGGGFGQVNALQDLLYLPLIVGLEAATRTQNLTQGGRRLHGQVLDHRGQLLLRR
jgi:hypothetical protein